MYLIIYEFNVKNLNLNVWIPIYVGPDDSDLLTEEENIDSSISAFYIHTLLVNSSKKEIHMRT